MVSLIKAGLAGNKTTVISLKNVIFSGCLKLRYGFKISRNCSSKTNQSHPQQKCAEQVELDTNVTIYDALVKRKTKLTLTSYNIVKWYSCGPTVYDSAHIGHASCYVKLDIIRRILMNTFDMNVFYLMGITDIDDKIILKSNEVKEGFKSLARRYEVEFFSDLQKLNVLPPTMTVNVSDHIPEIISFVKTLITKGYAYESPSGSVYFAAHSFARYGKLYPPQLSENPEKPNVEKRSPLDFTLWKAAKPGEPSWVSPWGSGRPGWHIECSAMASKVLGNQLDIHSGGQDLLFPHHENEEAQSCAYHDTSQWVNYWIHTGHLIVKGDVKMSKSLKNTISISELLTSYTSNQFRMLCLLSPYRNCIEYSADVMTTVVGTCRRIESFLDECGLHLTRVKAAVIDEAAVIKHIKDTRSAVRAHLADDFNTTKAVDEILKLISFVNSMISQPAMESTPRSYVAVTAAAQFVKHTLETLGYNFSSMNSGDVGSQRLTAVLDAAVSLRSEVRESALHSDMAAVKPLRSALLASCDHFRHSLSQAGVELKDHKSQKTTWSLKDSVSTSNEQE